MPTIASLEQQTSQLTNDLSLGGLAFAEYAEESLRLFFIGLASLPVDRRDAFITYYAAKLASVAMKKLQDWLMDATRQMLIQTLRRYEQRAAEARSAGDSSLHSYYVQKRANTVAVLRMLNPITMPNHNG